MSSNQTHKRCLALTIAGFDPSGGAGVIADVRTFSAFELEGVAAITSITFQNAERVSGAVHMTDEAVRSQVLSLIEGGEIVYAKIGMLPTRELVLEVARLFRETNLPRPVVDPVIMSSSGYRLMEEDATGALIDELLPQSQLLTPNIPEAEMLTGLIINSESDMREAAARLREMGARAVLVKGGHLSRQETGGGQIAHAKPADTGLSTDAIDVLDNEGTVTVFREPRVSGGGLHGSGCVLSAAIAAGLGKGMTMEDSVRAAKGFVLEAIRGAGNL